MSSVRALFLVGAALCVVAGAASAAPSASIEQVRNGVATATVTPTPTWGTGNAGASNSHYLESHSTAYRSVLDGLPTDGTVVELVIGYDVKRSGSYALDYLTQYQRLLPHVLFGHRNPEVIDPLDGISGVSPLVTTAPIPLPTRNLVIDPDGPESDPAAPQPFTSMASLPDGERVMTLFGGTLLDVTYLTEADVDLRTKSSETQVKVRFVPSGPRAVLAWGGHIACRWDWGFNADGTPRSAGGISGSSYHMRLVGWNLGSLGSMDRSMSTDAVFPVPRCAITPAGPFCAGSTIVHSAPTGMESYRWSLFDNTSGAVIVGSDSSTSVTVRTSMGGQYGLLLTTGASGFTKQCQAIVVVNASPTADAGPDEASCSTSPQVHLAGSVTGGNPSWTGGAGVFSPGRNDPQAFYTPTAAEIAAGGVTLTLVATPSSGPCPPASDPLRIVITPAATANAGAGLVACASAPQVQLAGAVGGGASGGTWSGGAGTFVPGASALNATYTPSPAEIAAGGVTLTLTTNDPAGPCDAASAQVRITINPAAVANAGGDQAVCASAPQVQLAGAVSGGATSGTWSGGTGTFVPNAQTLNATYTPSGSEIAAGGVTLTLTTNDPAGPCGAIADQVRITINPAATVNAGSDQIVCASSPQAQLAGSVGGGAGSGTWSGGAGSFSPKNTTLNATYTPTAGEIAAGSVTLTLTTNDPTGPCPPVSDQVTITIDPVTTANAGADQLVCASSPSVQLHGTVGGVASGGTWSGGTGSFSPGRGSLDVTYTPSPAEIAAGTVTLTLTSNATGRPCPPASDQVTITINPVATVNAGVDPVTCAVSPVVQLHGTVGGAATGATWTGGLGTFTPGRNVLNPTYTPTPGEVASGGVTLTLTTNDPAGPCGPVSDQVRIVYDQPTVTVPNKVTCDGVRPASLCANAGNGIPPYTYRWSNGATTQCIAVTDTGRYSVTVTDSKGCVATGSGSFGWRECVGMLAHTSTTCADFQAGTGQELLPADVHYNVSGGVISTISPGVFFYFTKIDAPRADFTIVIQQARSNSAFPFLELQQGQVALYDGDCNRVGDGVATGDGQAAVTVHGATLGKVYIVSVKYSLKTLVGVPFDPSYGVRYDFRTLIDGQIVDFDPDGIVLGTPAVTGVGDPPTTDGGGPELYRPMPNPFTDGMRMAYRVATPNDDVTIRVYDVAGRVVRTLVDATPDPGIHFAAWDGKDDAGVRVRQGMYFVRATVGGATRHARVTFVR